MPGRQKKKQRRMAIARSVPMVCSSGIIVKKTARNVNAQYHKDNILNSQVSAGSPTQAIKNIKRAAENIRSFI
jgi:hypothetical protein